MAKELPDGRKAIVPIELAQIVNDVIVPLKGTMNKGK